MKFSRQLHAAALATGLSSWIARRLPARRVVMFHGVDEIDMPVDAFETCLAWLAARFQMVSLQHLLDGILQGRPVAVRGEVALTFDDGLRNHFDTAYPVLQRLGLPATYFVCPDLIENRRWIWNHEARTRLRTMTPQARAEFARRTFGSSIDDIETLVQRMKGLRIEERQRAEADVRTQTPDFVPSALDRQRFDPLSWQELAELDPALITIGSHTLSHPILPLVDDDVLERELGGSRRVLEERLNRPVDLFCYPNGSTDDRVHAVVGRHYRAAVTTEYGFVKTGSDAHRVMRIPSSPHLALMAWRMHRPTA
jgi:peptidoglycan/xylan/chitin deacetylase (PgdA/CDA1 family)